MKKIHTLTSFLVAGSLMFSSIGNAIACTALSVTDVKGNLYYGRTMELNFNQPIPSSLTYMPANTKVESATPSGSHGMVFNTKYPVLGMSVNMVPGAKQPLILDGMNDQGLGLSANAFLNAATPPLGNDSAKIMSTNDIGAWILGNFKTVTELKAAISSDNTQFWLPKLPILGNLASPLHYIVFDKLGNSLVIEFVNGKKNIYDNPVGVMTNGPEFPWHLTNLSNYTQNNVDKNTGQLGKLKLQTQDGGIALAALPSAQTSQGRFVKAAFYTNYVQKGKTPDEAINLLGHIMNNFDRPNNLTVDPAGGVGDGGPTKTLTSEVTQWTVMGDLSRNQYYVRSINALNWTVIDMAALKNITEIKTISTYKVDQVNANAIR